MLSNSSHMWMAERALWWRDEFVIARNLLQADDADGTVSVNVSIDEELYQPPPFWVAEDADLPY